MSRGEMPLKLIKLFYMNNKWGPIIEDDEDMPDEEYDDDSWVEDD